MCLKYIFVFCVLYLKYILMNLYFNFRAKMQKYTYVFSLEFVRLSHSLINRHTVCCCVTVLFYKILYKIQNVEMTKNFFQAT